MPWTNKKAGYGRLAIVLHWMMLLLLVAVYATMEFGELLPKSDAPSLEHWHTLLGLSVLALVLIRLLVNLNQGSPPIEPAPSQWQLLAAKLMHLSLYVFMIAMPLLGWLLLRAEGELVTLLGRPLPSLVEGNARLADSAKDWHEIGGTLGYVLIGLHAAAALFHHYVLRDNTLIRMLSSPEGRRPRIDP